MAINQKKKKIAKLTFDDTKISDGLEFIYNKLFIMGNTWWSEHSKVFLRSLH